MDLREAHAMLSGATMLSLVGALTGCGGAQDLTLGFATPEALDVINEIEVYIVPTETDAIVKHLSCEQDLVGKLGTGQAPALEPSVVLKAPFKTTSLAVTVDAGGAAEPEDLLWVVTRRRVGGETVPVFEGCRRKAQGQSLEMQPVIPPGARLLPGRKLRGDNGWALQVKADATLGMLEYPLSGLRILFTAGDGANAVQIEGVTDSQGLSDAWIPSLSHSLARAHALALPDIVVTFELDME